MPDPFVSKINPDFCGTGVHPLADAGPDKTICKDDSVGIGTVGTGENKYAWTSIPSGFTSLKPNPSVSPANTTTYVLAVTSYNGLTSRDTVVVTVDGALDAGVDTAICEGSSIVIGRVLSSNYTYSWSSNPAGFSSSPPAPEVQPTVTTTYYVTMNSQVCSRQYTDSVRITVTPRVTPSVKVLANKVMPVCIGTNLVFNAEVVNAGERVAHQWYLNGQPVGTDNPVYSSATLKTGDEIYVSVSNDLPCATASTVKSDVIKVDLVVPVEPVVSISSSNTVPQCPGIEIVFQATGNGTSYQWYVNDEPVGTNSITFSSRDLHDRDRVSVVMSGDFRCASSQSVRSNDIVVMLNAPVEPYINITAGNTTVCPGTQITFQATTNGKGFQ